MLHRSALLVRPPAPGPADAACFAVAGTLPVALIALHMFGLPLGDMAVALLPPVAVAIALWRGRCRATRALLRRALVAGLAATALYDLFRLSLVWSGFLGSDPIPHIGLALGLEPAWLFGYAYRYIGDGAGLALTYLALGGRSARSGAAFGLAVCGGLLAALALSPHGQPFLFPLSIGTVFMATVGHLIYGATLGALAARPRRPGTAGA